MIEAVNSVISNAPFLRSSAEQLSSAVSFAADKVAVEAVSRAPLAPYISPFISVNTDYDKAVLQLRDSETGDVLTQFPSEQALEARQRAENQALNEQIAAETGSGASQSARSASRVTSSNFSSDITVVQQSAPTPAPTGGAGVAQAAIAAFSTGASAGAGATSTVSVTA